VGGFVGGLAAGKKKLLLFLDWKMFLFLLIF
jgi:hypothetical protein